MAPLEALPSPFFAGLPYFTFGSAGLACIMVSPSGVPCTILFIEDDPDDVFLFQRAFGRSAIQCNVQNVSNVHDAQAYLLGHLPFADRGKFPLPDLIITDLAFRGDSGLQFLNWLRFESDFKSVPVVCLTGSIDPAKLAQARAFTADCISKDHLFTNALDSIQKLLASVVH
jgi:CheY-like chemotaxis protein